MPIKRKDSESSNDEGDEHKGEDEVFERQDLYVVFTHERELRNVDQVKIKLSQFTGVVMRCKNVTSAAMENLLLAIEADALNFQMSQNSKAAQPQKIRLTAARPEMGGLSDSAPVATQTPTSGIVNLRFEECMFASKAIQLLKAFLSQKQLIETFCIQKVEFQDPVADFRALMEGLQFSIKIRKVGILGLLFDEEQYGKIMAHLLNDCRQLREFDASGSEFFHPKCFFDMCQAFIGEKCRVNILKLKGIHISNLEGKVLQFVLMKNKSLHTIDFSNAKVDSGECLEFFLQKLDKYSNIRYLVLDSVQPDLSSSLEILGEALSENTKLEVMIMRENKLKWVPYAAFWENIQGNTSLQKINVSKTDLSDRVLEKMCGYLISPELRLVDLDLSRNAITDIGLQNLSDSLMSNTSIKYLNLSQNIIRDMGLRSLVGYLSQQSCTLIELSLMGNKINNEGIHILSEFIKPNTSLKMLDISKNVYGDSAFANFAAEMGPNATLTFLDISKSKELNDEGSLIILAKQLAFNTYLQTLDLTGVRVRKPFLKLYMEPSLRKNITLKYVLGKLTPDIIDEQLNINIQIQTDVEPNYLKNPYKLGRQIFDVHLVDPDCNSRLSMVDCPNNLFDASFKFMQQIDVRQIDFSGMNLQDGQLYQIADYLQYAPNLRSMIINNNHSLTDDGILRLSTSLSINNKLAHISIMGCKALTSESLVNLNKVITEDNMMLCSVEFDDKKYDSEVAKSVKKEAMLNRAIQENLKPKFFMSNKGQIKKGNTLSNDTTQADHSPDRTLGVHHHGKQPISEEVAFQEGAQVNKYLASAIKCWRITMPVIIQIENQQLTDKHVLELCQFLRDKNMILNLNLRRNRITNVGALAIIDWMLLHDNALTHLDVSRNRITTAGAAAFLTALKKLTRIVDFQITYGNPIPLDISLAIGYEIVANNQIKANQAIENRVVNPNSKVTLTQGRYELIDRGPIYMRCAIKSVELLKITHLSLPDNMLGFEEAKMLAAMIKMNPPLKTLNLEINNLDAQCAKLLAEALQSNSNLQVLNISKNKLADLGIFWLLQALIKMRMKAVTEGAIEIEMQNIAKKKEESKSQHEQETQDAGLQKVATPQLGKQNSQPPPRHSTTAGRLSIRIPSNKDLASALPKGTSPKLVGDRTPATVVDNTPHRKRSNILLHSPKSQREQTPPLEVIPTEEIEKCEVGQLKILNLLENMATIESYKAILWLIQINPHMVLLFDSPLQMQQQQKQQYLLHEQSVRYQKLMSQKTAMSLDETQAKPLLGDKSHNQSSNTNIQDNDNEDPQHQRSNSVRNSDRAQQHLNNEEDEVASILSAEQDDPFQDSSNLAEYEVIVHQKNGCSHRVSQWSQHCTGKLVKVLRVLCCFRQENDSQKTNVGLKDVLFWRLLNWKQSAIQFNASNDLSNFDRPGLQTTITAFLLINQIGLYLFTVVPFALPHNEGVAGIILVSYLGWLWFFEVVVMLVAKKAVGLNVCNLYVWIQVVSGLLKKAAVLSLGLVGGCSTNEGKVTGFVLGGIALLMAAIDQYKTIFALKNVNRTDKTAVLPYSERSQRIADVYFYQGLGIVFKKITLLPSAQSQMLSQKIAYDLNPDLIKAPPTTLVAKVYETVKGWYHRNSLVRHLVFVDFSLFILTLIALATKLTHFSDTIAAMLVIVFLDSICCIGQLCESNQNMISLDANSVFQQATSRNATIGERYEKILMRETKDKELVTESENSIFDQNDQQPLMDFGQEQIRQQEASQPDFLQPDSINKVTSSQVAQQNNFMSLDNHDCETINVE